MTVTDERIQVYVDKLRAYLDGLPSRRTLIFFKEIYEALHAVSSEDRQAAYQAILRCSEPCHYSLRYGLPTEISEQLSQLPSPYLLEPEDVDILFSENAFYNPVNDTDKIEDAQSKVRLLIQRAKHG